MTPHDERRDANTSRNLSRLALHVRLPAVPEPSRQAAWTRADRRDAPADHLNSSGSPSSRKGHSPMRNRLFAATGLAAAALSAFFFIPGGVREVQAATIFRSLRDAAHRGIRVQLENIRAEGWLVEGRVSVVFPTAVTVEQLIGAGAAEAPDPDTFLVDLRVIGTEAEPEYAGFDLETTIAVTPADSWGFVKINDVPIELLEQQPYLHLLLNPMRNGLLFDLNGLAELDDSQIDEDFDVRSAFSVQTSVSGEAGPASAVSVTAKISTNSPDSDNDVDQVSGILADLENSGDLSAAFRSLLTGQLSGAQLSELAAEIEQVAQDVSVARQSDGSWLLTARQFRLDDESEDDARFLRNANLQIRYQEGIGVSLVELNNLGEANGRMRLEFIDGVDPADLRRDRFGEGRQAVNLRGLIDTFGGTP